MKIVSWNVNGMRAALGKGFLDWLDATDPDVLNVQEVRVEWEELDLESRREMEKRYTLCWFPCAIKKGYSGTATFVRKNIAVENTKGFGIHDHDQEGRIIVTRHPAFTLIAGYFPNASTELVRLPFKQKFSADLTSFIRQRHAAGEKLVVVGDLNVAPEEIDLANPKTNRRNPGFTDEEREDFRGYVREGLVDVFRERHPGEKGLYTWWSQRGGARARNTGWRIDMFLVSKDLAPKVKDAMIHPDVKGSDHCPVSIDLDV